MEKTRVVLKILFYSALISGGIGGIVLGRDIALPSFIVIVSSMVIYKCLFGRWIFYDNTED